MVSVRRVVASDEEAWLKLFRDYVVFYKASVPEEIIAQTWRRLLNQDDNMMALIATDDAGKALGIAVLVFHRSTWSAAWYCYLEDLFVAPEARGSGVARALIEATYAEEIPVAQLGLIGRRRRAMRLRARFTTGPAC